jgi:hypothetical protein
MGISIHTPTSNHYSLRPVAEDVAPSEENVDDLIRESRTENRVCQSWLAESREPRADLVHHAR